jgi:hypothetical protein
MGEKNRGGFARWNQRNFPEQEKGWPEQAEFALIAAEAPSQQQAGLAEGSD